MAPEAGGAAPRGNIAVLSSRREAGGGLLLVELDVDEDVRRSYTSPGQYIEVRTEAGDGYFVLAGDVEKGPFELLVKNAGDAADALFSRPIGTGLRVAGPLGAGFPYARMKDRHLVVAVVGSALAVARPVLKHRIDGGASSATHLFLGLRSPLDLPIAAEVAGWVAQGVAVVLCLSRAELHHHEEVLPGAKRVSGYVQLALTRALEDGSVPHGSLVIAAGPEQMLADMRALALSGSEGRARGSGAIMRPGPTIEVLTNV